MVGTDNEAVIVLVMAFWIPTIFFTLSSAVGAETGTWIFFAGAWVGALSLMDY